MLMREQVDVAALDFLLGDGRDVGPLVREFGGDGDLPERGGGNAVVVACVADVQFESAQHHFEAGRLLLHDQDFALAPPVHYFVDLDQVIGHTHFNMFF